MTDIFENGWGLGFVVDLPFRDLAFLESGLNVSAQGNSVAVSLIFGFCQGSLLRPTNALSPCLCCALYVAALTVAADVGLVTLQHSQARSLSSHSTSSVMAPSPVKGPGPAPKIGGVLVHNGGRADECPGS